MTDNQTRTTLTDDADGECTDPIDPYSDYSLRDVVAGSVPIGEATEYMGFHIAALGNDPTDFAVQLDGHAGQVMQFSADEYADPLALVDDLNALVIRRHEHDQAADDALIEWAGAIVTHDPDKRDDDTYLYVSDWTGDTDNFEPTD